MMAGKKSTRKSILTSIPRDNTKRVALEKISNGFVVTGFNDETFQERKKFAKTKTEAKKIATKFLG